MLDVDATLIEGSLGEGAGRAHGLEGRAIHTAAGRCLNIASAGHAASTGGPTVDKDCVEILVLVG